MPTKSSVQGLIKYMLEREQIRQRRMLGDPWPWTKDKILQRYKFTNVLREHDKTSIAFMGVYRGHMDNVPPWLLLYNCAVARWFGTAEFYTALGWQSNHDSAMLIHVAEARMAAGKPVFTRAYVITNGGRSMPKPEYVARHVLQDVWRNAAQVTLAMQKTHTWQAGYERLRRVEGHGGTGFMAKEVLLDYLACRWVHEHTDLVTFTPVGPGAMRGLGRILYQDPNHKVKNPLLEIHAMMPDITQAWDEAGQRRLSAADVQFNLCEYDKYERTRLGEGKPKNKYERRA